MFEEIDAELVAWGKQRSLPWSRLYQDSEVRSVELVLTGGFRAQIWVESNRGGWNVRGWDYAQRQFSQPAASGSMGQVLSAALAAIESWAESDNVSSGTR